eukprot:TRINITY_DN66300_c5_g10_i1.p1 TRINITY_DN66300_c5_g10~~TRINITY_DN66300_c5_g10_i1.p1  ORF type:complete len:962 (-),score=537.97 TRINITY_DN66300_c5_g10_i1:95-2980(-)
MSGRRRSSVGERQPGQPGQQQQRTKKKKKKKSVKLKVKKKSAKKQQQQQQQQGNEERSAARKKRSSKNRGGVGEASLSSSSSSSSLALRVSADRRAVGEVSDADVEQLSPAPSDSILSRFSQVSTASSVVEAVQKVRGSLYGMKRDLRTTARDMNRTMTSLSQAFRSLTRVVRTKEMSYRAEQDHRRLLSERLQAMEGHIRVVCRVRPLVHDELHSHESEVIEYPGSNQISVLRSASSRGAKAPFRFDRVLGPKSTQHQVFEEVEPLVLSALDGFNVCVFAYGHTGSGKTHTMEGPPNDPGVTFRSIKTLFHAAENRHTQYEVYISYLEIYNEALRDLLNTDQLNSAAGNNNNNNNNSNASSAASPKSNSRRHSRRNSQPDWDSDDDNDGGNANGDDANYLKIRVTSKGVAVSNLVKVRVRSVDEVSQVLRTGAKNRATGTHDVNARSSRSHGIVVITVKGSDPDSGRESRGKIYFVDLAGSERQKQTKSSGQTFLEATFINKSLSALGNVMLTLSQNKKNAHVPYRDSKLTQLLQDALGGNSRTMMFVNLSPADHHARESLSSLQFAKRVMKVNQSATAHLENKTLDKYKEQLAQLEERSRSAQEKLTRALRRSEAESQAKDAELLDLRDQLRKALSRLEKSDVMRRKEIAELRAEHEKRSRQVMAEDAKKLNEKYQSMNQQLQSKYNAARKSLQQLRQEHNQMQMEANTEKAELERKVSETTQHSRWLEQQVDKLNRRVREMDQDKKADAEKRKLIKDENRQLEAEIAELRDVNRKLSKNFEDMQAAMKLNMHVIQEETRSQHLRRVRSASSVGQLSSRSMSSAGGGSMGVVSDSASAHAQAHGANRSSVFRLAREAQFRMARESHRSNSPSRRSREDRRNAPRPWHSSSAFRPKKHMSSSASASNLSTASAPNSSSTTPERPKSAKKRSTKSRSSSPKRRSRRRMSSASSTKSAKQLS